MRRAGPLSVFLLSVFLLACVMERVGDAADRGAGESSPGAAPLPGLWVLLEERPQLWDSPEGRSTGTNLDIAALQRVEAIEAAAGGSLADRWIRVKGGGQTGWLPEALLAPPPAAIDAERMDAIGREIVDRFHGLPPEYAPGDLIEVRFGYEAERKYQLRREAALALEKMIRTARREGLNLQVVSAYRSYDTQRSVYLNKLKRSGWKQQTVAKPGHSEHQLGTTVDLTGGDESTLLRESFGETPEGRWLRERGPEFGFAVSYTAHNRERTGYAPEPWHYRYYGPELAGELHAKALGAASE